MCIDPRDGAPVSPEDAIRLSPNKIKEFTVTAEIDKDTPNKATIEVLTFSGCSKEIHRISSKTGKFTTEADWELHPTEHNKQTLKFWCIHADNYRHYQEIVLEIATPNIQFVDPCKLQQTSPNSDHVESIELERSQIQ